MMMKYRGTCRNNRKKVTELRKSDTFCYLSCCCTMRWYNSVRLWWNHQMIALHIKHSLRIIFRNKNGNTYIMALHTFCFTHEPHKTQRIACGSFRFPITLMHIEKRDRPMRACVTVFKWDVGRWHALCDIFRYYLQPGWCWSRWW